MACTRQKNIAPRLLNAGATQEEPGSEGLKFYKVIESQFSDGQKKAEWITANIDKLTDRAAKRVAELRAAGIDVSRHLFDSGRCAVAHASLDGEIIDPDIPADRRRLSADLVIMEELALTYIRNELQVPDSRFLYRRLLSERIRISSTKYYLDNESRVFAPAWVDGVVRVQEAVD